MDQTLQATITVDEAATGQRLDQYLTTLYPEYSRSRVQEWIKSGDVRLNGQRVKTGVRLKGIETINVDVTISAVIDDRPEAIRLDIIHEDEQVLVMNKPAGLVVHPGAGNATGTLVNGLLNHCADLEKLPRAGIVHRLDKLTSGIMVVAKTPAAHKSLIDQLQDRSMGREYTALVYGHMIAGGTVDAPIDRHPVNRKRMAISATGKPAVTHYRINRKFRYFTLLDLKLESGRTHQIRVHMASINHAVVCDPVYGPGVRVPKAAPDLLVERMQGFRRQALHARELTFVHPATGEVQQYATPVPQDMKELVAAIPDE